MHTIYASAPPTNPSSPTTHHPTTEIYSSLSIPPEHVPKDVIPLTQSASAYPPLLLKQTSYSKILVLADIHKSPLIPPPPITTTTKTALEILKYSFVQFSLLKKDPFCSSVDRIPSTDTKPRCLLKASAKPTFRISELGLNGWASISTQVLLAWRALLPIARHILIVVQQRSDRAHGLHTNDLVRHEVGDVETPVHWAHRHVELVGRRLRAVCRTRTRLCY